MRILHVLVALNKAGTERLVLSLAKYQQQRGETVKVLAFCDEDDFPELTKDLDVEYTIENTFTNRLFGEPYQNTTHFEQLLDDFKPDLIHSHSLWVDWVVHACYRPNIKYVSHLHVYNQLFYPFSIDAKFKSEVLKILDKKLITKWYKEHQSKLILVSQDMFDFHQKNLSNTVEHQLFLVNNGIDLSYFMPRSKNKEEGKLRLISVGRLEWMKNISFLIDVAEELKKKKVDFQLDVFGDGTQMTMLNNKIEELGLQNHVFLKGEVEGLGNLYPQYDIYLHSALEEPFGLSILEAMACGLPCVALDAKGNRALIKNGKNGFLLSQNTLPIRFSDKIVEASKEENFARFSQESIEMSKAFSLEVMVNKIDHIYSL